LAYQIDAEGRIKLGNRLVPISTRISEAAQRFLATPPWGDGPAPSGEPVPMWTRGSDAACALAYAELA